MMVQYHCSRGKKLFWYKITMGSHHCIHRAQHCYFFVFTENGREAQGECKESLRVLKRCSLKKELFKFHSIFIDLPLVISLLFFINSFLERGSKLNLLQIATWWLAKNKILFTRKKSSLKEIDTSHILLCICLQNYCMAIKYRSPNKKICCKFSG